jgi:anti-sigma regulatory factor (Ser/Thr protein kinase)
MPGKAKGLRGIEMSRFRPDLQTIVQPLSGSIIPTRPVSRAKSFPGRLDQLSRIRGFVKEVAREAHLDSETVFSLQLAVSEASANAIEHGLPRGDVELSAVFADERLTFTVSHPGRFRPRVGVDPARTCRGMGMPLMLALTDEVVVSHPPGKGTTVSLSLWLR